MNITGGKYNGQKILAPEESITRPTLSKVRMAVFNTLYSMIEFNDANFLDMYAGSGIMGLEAISRGFKSALSIEKNPKAVSIIKSNFKKFEDSNISLLIGDSIKICRSLEEKYNVIYIDPPYFSGIYEQSLDAINKISDGIIVLEHVTDVNFKDHKILKQKKFSDKFITFLKYNQ